ncbi:MULTISPECIES: DUF397 domain-containing protein [Streptomyces]|uniref:DUF397 domain-containing protein n=1 Tax=Streptomyces koelreuteriae TaxID=2838015 RepID=A0ABX8FWT9_9ACTN|nr:MULTISPECIES: DUF397 domain-containing protein [Streptomyces]QWB25452.1 DUF397 domain-containing protein [Streptomyces koelreuteriae]UUA08496.1 DUF397 domain-containing protein [Streptomyces koelreuteriae]UUA16101.1 DUF397 domain-containing protein [Streptomyces sp. CRCS-T-1]
MISSERTGWFKSSYSGGSQADCLEVAHGHPDIPVRDSKSTPGPTLTFSATGWTAFVTAIKDGHFTAASCS